MMNIYLIAGLVAVALIILVLVLRKPSEKQVPQVEPPDEEISAPPLEEAEAELEAEPELISEIEEPTAEEDVEEAAEVETEETAPPPDEVVEETAEAVTETEVIIEPEAVPEPELAEEVEPEPVTEPEVEPVSEIEEPSIEEGVEETAEAEKEEVTPPPEEAVEEVAVEEAAEKPVAALSLASYEQRLLALKDKQLTALTGAIENNEESRREQLQGELVAITEGLSFLDQGYAQEMSCRNEALAALEQMQPDLDTADFEQAFESVSNGDTGEAEQLFDSFAGQNGPLSALAAFQSGRLAECRMDLNRAMEQLEKAVTLDDKNPDYLRSAALLARKLYHHKKALAWFTSLVKLGEEKGEDTVELALDRRELAYTTALVGQHKQAGVLYKKAMVSLTNLLGKEDPEMGICWFQIGKLQEALGQYEKADDPYTKALAIMDKSGSNAVLGDILDKLAGLYMELEREDEAMVLFERLCSLKEASPNPDNATLAIAYNNFAEASRICGKYEEAEKSYKRSLAITEELRGKDHAAVGSLLQELAQLCERQKKKDEAKVYQERAAAIFQRVLDAQEAAGQQAEKLKLSE
ncbi:MAG: tetratricopeptide repeat protein [Thermodesulfobacteriota bacterium]|nr:tetratricopeptide repeat protein [Thermodesulfobacteriota bacterium]